MLSSASATKKTTCAPSISSSSSSSSSSTKHRVPSSTIGAPLVVLRSIAAVANPPCARAQWPCNASQRLRAVTPAHLPCSVRWPAKSPVVDARRNPLELVGGRARRCWCPLPLPLPRHRSPIAIDTAKPSPRWAGHSGDQAPSVSTSFPSPTTASWRPKMVRRCRCHQPLHGRIAIP